MKLRNRTKRVLGNIKQEDRKSDLNAVESYTAITHDTNTVKLTVKQEDTKDHKLLLKQQGESATKDYNHQCDVCNERMANLKAVLEHRISIHNIKLNASRILKNVNVEPDIHDPNFYCKSCEKGYISKGVFRHHLRGVHYLVLKPLPKQKAPQPDVVPDPDDPNLYCRACDLTYKQNYQYKAHCRYKHGMKLAESNSGSTIDTYCQACDMRLSSLQSYRNHLFLIHKVDSRPMQQKQNNVLPNVNDSNFYCCSCDKKLANKRSFKQHLMAIHSIFPSAPRKRSRLKPNVDDPNNNCRACKRTYPSKCKYRHHLRLVHQMALPRLIGKAKHTDLPDPHSLDHYCNVCKKMYASLRLYRYHCRYVHFMVLKPISIINPNATIDINSPEHYCSQCEHTFTKTFFKKHLRRVHNIV